MLLEVGIEECFQVGLPSGSIIAEITVNFVSMHSCYVPDQGMLAPRFAATLPALKPILVLSRNSSRAPGVLAF